MDISIIILYILVLFVLILFIFFIVNINKYKITKMGLTILYAGNQWKNTASIYPVLDTFPDIIIGKEIMNNDLAEIEIFKSNTCIITTNFDTRDNSKWKSSGINKFDIAYRWLYINYWFVISQNSDKTHGTLFAIRKGLGLKEIKATNYINKEIRCEFILLNDQRIIGYPIHTSYTALGIKEYENNKFGLSWDVDGENIKRFYNIIDVYLEDYKKYKNNNNVLQIFGGDFNQSCFIISKILNFDKICNSYPGPYIRTSTYSSSSYSVWWPNACIDQIYIPKHIKILGGNMHYSGADDHLFFSFNIDYKLTSPSELLQDSNEKPLDNYLNEVKDIIYNTYNNINKKQMLDIIEKIKNI